MKNLIITLVYLFMLNPVCTEISYDEFQSRFTKIKPLKKHFKSIVPHYSFQCIPQHPAYFVDTTCTRYLGHNFKKKFLQPDLGVAIAHSYTVLSDSLQLFFVEEWGYAEPRPYLFLYSFKNGIKKDKILIYADPIPKDSNSEEVIRFEILEINEEFEIRVTEKIVRAGLDQEATFHHTDYVLKNGQFKLSRKPRNINFR